MTLQDFEIDYNIDVRKKYSCSYCSTGYMNALGWCVKCGERINDMPPFDVIVPFGWQGEVFPGDIMEPI